MGVLPVLCGLCAHGRCSTQVNSACVCLKHARSIFLLASLHASCNLAMTHRRHCLCAAYKEVAFLCICLVRRNTQAKSTLDQHAQGTAATLPPLCCQKGRHDRLLFVLVEQFLQCHGVLLHGSSLSSCSNRGHTYKVGLEINGERHCAAQAAARAAFPPLRRIHSSKSPKT